MKIFISVDIEGCAGVANWAETERGNDDYELFRKIMTDEVNSVIDGLMSAGVDEILVRDAHGTARNLLFDKLNPNIKIIRGWSNSPCEMMDGLDSSFDGAIFIGYHSPSRSDGNPLSHTLSLNMHNHIKLNGKILSEYHINTYYAMTKGVPVILISGDKNICEIASAENNLIETVETKAGINGAIISRMPKDVLNELSHKTIDAINTLREQQKDDYYIFLPKNMELEIQYRKIESANKASFYPGAIRLSADKVIYRTNKIEDVFRFLFFCD